jgi:hypothetical protein
MTETTTNRRLADPEFRRLVAKLDPRIVEDLAEIARDLELAGHDPSGVTVGELLYEPELSTGPRE